MVQFWVPLPLFLEIVSTGIRWTQAMKAKTSITDPVRLVSGRSIGLSAIYRGPGEDVWLRHQILLGVQQLPHVVSFLLQQHPEELAVHRAGQAHLLVVLRGSTQTLKSAHLALRLKPAAN